MLVPTELTLKLQSLLDEHISDILGNGSKCLDMGLDLLGLDILGIILHVCHAHNITCAACLCSKFASTISIHENYKFCAIWYNYVCHCMH